MQCCSIKHNVANVRAALYLAEVSSLLRHCQIIAYNAYIAWNTGLWGSRHHTQGAQRFLAECQRLTISSGLRYCIE